MNRYAPHLETWASVRQSPFSKKRRFVNARRIETHGKWGVNKKTILQSLQFYNQSSQFHKTMHLLKQFVQTLFFIGVLSMGVFAQTGDVRGFVYDTGTGEPVLFTNVYLEGTTYGATTDINGFYAISKVPAGDYNLLCTFVGYDTTRVAITIQAGQITNQKLFVSESDIMMDVVEISAEKEEAKTEIRTSTIKLSAKQITQIPAIGGEPDLAQYLQVLPGVVFTGDQGGQLYIRGGSLIQTEVLLDGVRVYNPFHSIGLFSVFETDIIRNVDVMTGGFGAEYGGSISAVIDITTRDGNKKRHSGKVAANTFLAKALIEGPIIKLKEGGSGFTGSYVLTAKSSYLEQSSNSLYSYIDDISVDGTEVSKLPYRFTDIYGKVAFNADSGSKFSLSGYRFDDDANFQGVSDYEWLSWGVGTNFVLVPGQSKAIIDGRFAYSGYDLQLLEANDELNRPRTSSIKGFNGGVNFSYFMPKGSLKYGIEVAGYSTTFEFYNPLGFKIDENQNTTEMGGFLQFKVELGKLLIEPSARANFFASLPAFTFEPRIGMKYNLADNLRLKASAGIYKQNFTSTKSDRDVVNLFTGFLSTPEDQLEDTDGNDVKNNLQSAIHAIGGVEIDLSRELSLNVEGYYKNFNQLVNINRNKLFPTDPNYLVENGKAYGLDMLFKFDSKRLFAWMVYSLAYVNRNDGNQVYPPHFDRRHNLNFLASYKLGSNRDWELSARWNYGSGFPFTKTLGFYEQLNFTDGIDTDITNQNGQLGIAYEENLNGGRLPDYHRFDLSMKKTFTLGVHSKLEVNASVTNIYNRENIFYFDRVRFQRLNQLPILPSLGVSMTF